jgi:hypothetical protein
MARFWRQDGWLPIPFDEDRPENQVSQEIHYPAVSRPLNVQ